MGSGRSGIYNGTGGGSQAYTARYHVVESMLNADKKDTDIYNPSTGYFKNPRATSLEDAIHGNSIYSDGHLAEGSMTYVLDNKGNIIFGKRYNPNNPSKRSPHPTLIGGKDPQVQCAGMITFQRGKIVSVNTLSGHYRPNSKSLEKVTLALDKLYNEHPEVFSRNSKWRK